MLFSQMKTLDKGLKNSRFFEDKNIFGQGEKGQEPEEGQDQENKPNRNKAHINDTKQNITTQLRDTTLFEALKKTRRFTTLTLKPVSSRSDWFLFSRLS